MKPAIKKAMTPEVDAFLEKAEKWPAELRKLRAILLEGGLSEGIKWRQPCYSYEGNNVAIIGGWQGRHSQGRFHVGGTGSWAGARPDGRNYAVPTGNYAVHQGNYIRPVGR